MTKNKKTGAGPVRDIPHYLRVFQSYIGPRMYLVFALALMAALAEGVGIVMLLPLLQTLDGFASEMTTGIGGALTNILDMLGLGGSTLAILFFIAGFFVLKAVFLFLAKGYQAYLQGQLMREMKGRLYDDYGRMQLQYYISRDTGHFINVINTQIRQMLSAFTSMIELVTKFVATLVYIGTAFAVAWLFGLMALVIGAVLLVALQRLNAYVRDLSRKQSLEAGHLSKLLIQSLQAMKYLTATGQHPDLRAGAMQSIRRLTSYQVRNGVANAFTTTVYEPLAVAAILLIVAVQLVWLNQPLGPILVSIVLFYRGLSSMTKLQGILQRALANIGALEMVRDEFRIQEQHRERDGHRIIGPLKHRIELSNVHFAYGVGQDDVLKGVSLTIPARTSVALVGESGAGKSTLVDLLTLALRPREGALRIDDIPGEDIQLLSWRRQIGYVSQETVVFDDTIANNICMWKGDPHRDSSLMRRVREAAQQAHIEHFIETLPDGYDTLVGDRGIRLSGGQRQRLFIARELFRKPNLLILDEATSALDTESERYIQQSIDALKGQITVVIIAHRLSTIRNVDHVFVFDKGRLIEEGSYDRLRDAEDSRFGRLVAMQSL
jgi:subfamily B ATP-binding cassette protein MsbA